MALSLQLHVVSSLAVSLAGGESKRAFSYACPPLLNGDNISAEAKRVGCSPTEARTLYAALLRQHTSSFWMLWLAAVADFAQRRYEAYFRLFQTMRELECILVFKPCWPGDEQAWTEVLLAACIIFRAEMDEVLWWDHKTRAAAHYTWTGSRSVNRTADLNDHACYALGGVTINQQAHLHDVLRRQASVPASQHLMRKLGRGAVPGTASVPQWIVPAVHSPGGICGREGVRWNEVPSVGGLLATRKRGWVVNLGAESGSCDYEPFGLGLLEVDPANCLLLQGHGGIIVEGDVASQRQLQESFAGRGDVSLLKSFVTPEDFTRWMRSRLDYFKAYPLHLVKVDVDNCDCCFLEQILDGLGTASGGSRPLLIHVEVHALVPPPIVFRPAEYDARLGNTLAQMKRSRGRWGHMMHCSLSAFVEILRPMGYELKHMAFHNAVFVDMAAKVGEQQAARQTPLTEAEVSTHWVGGYYCHPLRPVNELELAYQETFLYDYRRWNDPARPPAERVEVIRAYLDHHGIERGRYHLHL